jgi:hypothetical protein
MSVTITDDRMTSDLTDVVATLVDAEAGLWTVTGRHGLYDRNRAQTAMTIAELRAHKQPCANDTIMIDAFEQELLVPVMPRDPWALLQTLTAAASAVRALPESERFAAPPFGGDIAECLLRIGAAVVDLGAVVDTLSNLAHHIARDTSFAEWHRAVDRADDAHKRLRGAASDLRAAAGLAAKAAQREARHGGR